jgi:hypothetical protein
LVSRAETVSKGFNAFAIGILVFLIIDVFSHAWESAEEAANDDVVAGNLSIITKTRSSLSFSYSILDLNQNQLSCTL